MVHFHAKNQKLGTFWRALEWKMLVFFQSILNILRPFGVFYGNLVIAYIFSRFGMLFQKKSGNPEFDAK
jgi:hypothetical protein